MLFHYVMFSIKSWTLDPPPSLGKYLYPSDPPSRKIYWIRACFFSLFLKLGNKFNRILQNKIGGALNANDQFFPFFSYDNDETDVLCTITWTCNGRAAFASFIYALSVVCFILPCCIIIVSYRKTYQFIKAVGAGGSQENIEWTHQKQITKAGLNGNIQFNKYTQIDSQQPIYVSNLMRFSNITSS